MIECSCVYQWRLSIDYNMSIGQMVACGRYDVYDLEMISMEFEIIGAGIVKIKAALCRLAPGISSLEAVEEIKMAGWESAKIEHLLALGARFPAVQRMGHPIVALGAHTARGLDGLVADAPYLFSDHRGRILDVTDWDWNAKWSDDCRFLVVRTI